MSRNQPPCKLRETKLLTPFPRTAPLKAITFNPERFINWRRHGPLSSLSAPCRVSLDLRRRSEFGLEMTREAKGQGDHSQGRIGKTASGKNRAAGDEEIWYVMNPAIGIDHAVPRVLVHPGGTEEVVRAVELPGLTAGDFPPRG